ncbi:hypothetical protein [Allostreptomyces psammosilenae]|uniref:Integral membrane protein n=1 Tax=Allostreptomyces psammosilenae TaxID=1892865 RepID=A0A853ABA2_9ACTN|nr:hypothetical protein [Allostreptomyces psammosilenae]NYI07891.1 hypothetical protein [Allostreptomyces psammosilenae]
MDVAVDIFLILHFIGIASLLGGFLTQMRAMRTGEVRVVPAMVHGALTMLVTGLVMVGLRQADGAEVDNFKIGVKTAVLLAILVLVWLNRDKERVSPGVLGAIGGLTVVNICVAVLWN